MDGKIMTGIIAVWLVVKSLVNLFLGFGIKNLFSLVLSVVFAILLINGISKINYVAAILMTAVVLMHLIPNITGGHFFYLLEGLIDLIGVVMLCFNQEVKEYFDSCGEE